MSTYGVNGGPGPSPSLEAKGCWFLLEKAVWSSTNHSQQESSVWTGLLFFYLTVWINMGSGETTAKCPGMWMWPVCSIWPQGPENRSWPSFYLTVQKQSEVQRNTPKYDRCFSHKSKMKGTNRTKAAPVRRPAWVSGSRWAEYLASCILQIEPFFLWSSLSDWLRWSSMAKGLGFGQSPEKKIGTGGVPDYS